MIHVYVIYIDILFLINFTMNCFVLLLVKKVLKQTTTWLRLLAASITGAAWVCFVSVFRINNQFVEFILSNIMIGLLMLMIAFRIKIKNIHNVIRNLTVLYISTFLLGGIFNSIYYHTNIGYYLNKIIRGEYERKSDIGLFLLMGIAAFFIAMKMIYITDQKKKLEQNLFAVQIELNGNIIKTIGLLDTGNSLYEPIGRKPVSIIEYDLIKDYMGNDGKPNLRVIPFKSIGKEQGIMYGITVNQLIIDKNVIDTDKEILLVDNAVLGFYDRNFSKKNGYHMILHPDLFKNTG